ncbi:MAG: ornithine carbamoyltransferase [Gemmatimonadales bacterium]|nr:MAG: ornithine carbamoyltransferase [Gemmatimonadales bacterium]
MPARSSVPHFRTLRDLSAGQLRDLLALGERLAAGRPPEPDPRPLAGRSVALIFEKNSTRTRVSFEVGVHQLGGFPIFLSESDTQMGRGEPLRDTARVLSGYVDGIMIRTYEQETVEELARFSRVPIINGLTDLYHPCQLLADLLTMQQEFGAGRLGELRVAWFGDGNNMANSWLNAAAMLGFELRLAVPEGFDPDPETLERARGETSVLLTRDPKEAARGAHVFNTDVWASMGQEEEAEDRSAHFRPFQVDEELLALGAEDAIFLHCLPAHRGEEVTEGVLEGDRSRVFQEAENRLHGQKALLVHLLG